MSEVTVTAPEIVSPELVPVVPENIAEIKPEIAVLPLETRFQTAADSAKLFTKKPSDEELLKLYSLFKQGTIGDCNTPQPGFFEFVNKAKWNAWNALKGKTKEQAMEEYIAFVTELAAKL